jgi:hypothetical protein
MFRFILVRLLVWLLVRPVYWLKRSHWLFKLRHLHLLLLACRFLKIEHTLLPLATRGLIGRRLARNPI